MELFRGLIESNEGETSYFATIWASASHIGEAVERLLIVARDNEIKNPILVELDYSDVPDFPESVIQINGLDLYIADSGNYFPSEYSYRLPYGVIAAGGESEVDVDQIRPGFSVIEYDDGLFEIVVVVEEENLLQVYLETVRLLKDIRCFWIKLHDDWENKGTEEIYVNETINSVAKIEAFVRHNSLDTLLNGHVSLTAFSDAGQTNVNLNDHKMLVVLTYDKAFAKYVSKNLRENRLQELVEFFSIEEGFHHWHFRHPKASDRENLAKKLMHDGFKLWKPKE